MRFAALSASLVFFTLLQIGALPFMFVLFPVLPAATTAYAYFLMLVPFLWLVRRNGLHPAWKVAALSLPVVIGVGVPLLTRMLGEAAVAAQFPPATTVSLVPTPKSVDIVVPGVARNKDLVCDRICQLILVSSPQIVSVRLVPQNQKGGKRPTEVKLAMSGPCLRLPELTQLDPRMQVRLADGFCVVTQGAPLDASDLTLERRGPTLKARGNVDFQDIFPVASAPEIKHQLIVTRPDGYSQVWSEVSYAFPALPLRRELKSCQVFYCLGPTDWVREQNVRNAFDEEDIVRQILSLQSPDTEVSLAQLVSRVLDSPRSEFTTAQSEILGIWADSQRSTFEAERLDDGTAEVIGRLLADARLEGPVINGIMVALRHHPELVDRNIDALLAASQRSAKSDSSLQYAILMASQPVLERHRAGIEALIAAAGADADRTILGLAGRLGRDLTEDVAAQIAAGKTRGAIFLACLSGPPMSDDLANVIADLMVKHPGGEALYAVQALAVRNRLDVGIEAAVSANIFSKQWIKQARTQPVDGDVRRCV